MGITRKTRGARGASRLAEAKRLQMEYRKHIVARELCKMTPKGTIAKELGVSPATVTKLCKELDREWRTQHSKDILTHKARELACIDHREAFCWEQLYKSMEIRRQDQQFTDAEGESTVTTTLAGRAGLTANGQATTMQLEVADPRWMDQIARCSEQRCRLLGLYEAVEVTLTPEYFDKFTVEELQRLAAGEPVYLVERDCDERIRRERMREAQ